MKETKGPRKIEKEEGSPHQKRWYRNVDGTYRYKGRCPFNRSVCRLINSFTRSMTETRVG